jgi:hypothetical protein
LEAEATYWKLSDRRLLTTSFCPLLTAEDEEEAVVGRSVFFRAL